MNRSRILFRHMSAAGVELVGESVPDSSGALRMMHLHRRGGAYDNTRIELGPVEIALLRTAIQRLDEDEAAMRARDARLAEVA